MEGRYNGGWADWRQGVQLGMCCSNLDVSSCNLDEGDGMQQERKELRYRGNRTSRTLGHDSVPGERKAGVKNNSQVLDFGKWMDIEVRNSLWGKGSFETY